MPDELSGPPAEIRHLVPGDFVSYGHLGTIRVDIDRGVVVADEEGLLVI